MSKNKYNLCVVHKDWEMQIYHDITLSFTYALKELGHEVTYSINKIGDDCINIIFGAHISPGTLITQLPDNSIIYNTEQFGSYWMNEDYLNLLRRFKVWDYSQYNVECLKQYSQVQNITYNPVGYCPLLERIKHVPEEEKDIDVLLYGSVNDRRLKIMDELKNQGLTVYFANGIYGKERDDTIARSKVVLNVHFFPSAILETIRLSYLLNNKCFVVTEVSVDWQRCPEYQFTCVMSDYNWITTDIMEYVKFPKRRENVSKCGYDIFKEFKQEEVLNVEA
jgi:hypothetical protein